MGRFNCFQQFQRYIHDQISIDEYLKYINLNQKKYHSSFPLYSSDAEIFDFRPGRFNDEAVINQNEWKKIKELLSLLKEKHKVEFMFPSESLKYYNYKKEVKLECSEQPILVKKQDKYNINRWSLTGRDDLFLNTFCYNFFKKIENSNKENYWKKLCYYWSSDFRTHLTENRWEKLMFQIEKENILLKNTSFYPKISSMNLKEPSERYVELKNKNIKLILDSKKGNTIKELFFNKFDSKPILGTLNHGYFNQVEFAFDFFSGNSLIERLGSKKITDLGFVKMNYKNSDKIQTFVQDKDVVFETKLSIINDKIVCEKKIFLKRRNKELIHPYYFTLVPDSWDKNSLYFSSNNGGDIEKYYIKNSFNHSEKLSFQISSIHGLGNTEGNLIIGDKNKKLIFTNNNLKSSLIPKILYKEIDEKYLFRIIYSAQEIDDNFKENDNSQVISSEISIQLQTN